MMLVVPGRQEPQPAAPAAPARHAAQTVQRLLASAVADPSVTVRHTILEALSRTTALETHLAQAECLRSLFVALNDESSTVRSLTIQLAGHISPANPAYVMPALRRHLMQLLSDMDHSPDSRQREGAWHACLWWGWVQGRMRARLSGHHHHRRPLTHASNSPPPTKQRARGCWAC